MNRNIIATLLVICIIASLMGCSNNENPSESDQVEGLPGTSSIVTPESSQLQHVGEMLGRYGTNEGFYYSKSTHIPLTSNYADDYENLMYIDYASKKNVYLCSKSNCTHKDSSCTSYINVEGAQGLFTYGDKLYRLSNAYSPDGKTVVPGLFVSNLDGSNQRMIYSLESGMTWLRDFVFGDGKLYADVMVMKQNDSEDDSLGFGFAQGDDNDSQLLCIDLSSGEAKIILDLTDKKVIGTFEQWIILSENKDGKLTFERYDSKTKAVEVINKITNTYAVTVGNSMIYYALPEENIVYAANILTGETSTLAENLPSIPNYLEYHDGIVLYTSTGKENTTSHYAVDVESKTVSNIALHKTGIDIEIPVEIEAQWEDYFLLTSGYKMETEYVDWVGVWQDYIDSELFALIKKEDFLAAKAEYIHIK